MSPRRLAVLVLVLPLAACRARERAPPLAIHLVDLHRPAETAAKAAGPAAAAPAVPLGDWKAGPGVVELAVRDGLLTGRTTTDFPLIHLEQPPEALRGDVLHSVEVRLKVSAGGNVGFAFRGGEKLDLQQVLKFAGEFPWAMTSPLVPGPELQTLTLRPPRPEPAAAWRERPAFVERALTKDPGAPPPHDRESYAVIAGGWRLIHHVRRPAGEPEYELYDERRDPLDRTDLAAREPARVRAMAKVLADWRRAAVAARLAPDAAAAKGLAPEELERLRSLGYIQ